jgi:hypothetical protein
MLTTVMTKLKGDAWPLLDGLQGGTRRDLAREVIAGFIER